MADEAEPNDRDTIAETRICLPEAVKGDRAERRESRIAHGDVSRDGHAQIPGNRQDLRVRGSVSATSNDVPRRKAANASADAHDGAGGAVAEWAECLKTVPDRVDRSADAVRPHFLDDLADLVGTLPSLPEKALAANLDLCSLRPRADERRARSHKDLPLVELGWGDIHDADPAVFEFLRDLLHGMPKKTDGPLAFLCFSFTSMYRHNVSA